MLGEPGQQVESTHWIEVAGEVGEPERTGGTEGGWAWGTLRFPCGADSPGSTVRVNLLSAAYRLGHFWLVL